MKNNVKKIVRLFFLSLALMIGVFLISCAFDKRSSEARDAIEEFKNNKIVIDDLEFNNPITHILSSRGSISNKILTVSGSVLIIKESEYANLDIETVNFPRSLFRIEKNAFSNSELKGSVRLPRTVGSVEAGAFYANEITAVTLSDSLTYIGNESFYGNKIASLTVPSLVTYIGNKSFENNNIENLTLPDELAYIGDSAFGFNDITNIIIPSSLTVLETFVFFSNKIVSVDIPNSIIQIKFGAFANNEITRLTISNKILLIGNSAFEKNKLTSVTIPDSISNINQIGNEAFGSNKLTTVTLSKTLYDALLNENEEHTKLASIFNNQIYEETAPVKQITFYNSANNEVLGTH